MYVNLKYYLDNNLINIESDIYMNEIYPKSFNTLTEEQIELKEYLEKKETIDGILNIGVLSKQKYFSPENSEAVVSVFCDEINAIKTCSEYQKQLDESISVHSKRSTIHNIIRILTKFPEAVSSSGGAATAYILFIPGIFKTFSLAFKRDITLYENLIKTIEKQKDRAHFARQEYQERKKESFEKHKEKIKKTAEKEAQKEARKAQKEALKAYNNSPEGQKEAKKQKILYEIERLNRDIVTDTNLMRQLGNRSLEPQINRNKGKIATLNSELLSLS